MTELENKILDHRKYILDRLGTIPMDRFNVYLLVGYELETEILRSEHYRFKDIAMESYHMEIFGMRVTPTNAIKPNEFRITLEPK